MTAMHLESKYFMTIWISRILILRFFVILISTEIKGEFDWIILSETFIGDHANWHKLTQQLNIIPLYYLCVNPSR